MHMEQCRASLCDMVSEGFAWVEMPSALLTSDHVLSCITGSIQTHYKKIQIFQISGLKHTCMNVNSTGSCYRSLIKCLILKFSANFTITEITY